MSVEEFSVFHAGERVLMHAEQNVLRIGDPSLEGRLIQWDEIEELTHPNLASVRLRLAEESLDVAFMSRSERDRFSRLAEQLRVPGAAKSILPTPSLSSDFPLLTIDHVPGRQIVEVRGFVTSQAVMSRHVFSDMGSDLKNVVGGNLGGMEKAVARAIDAAKQGLARAAFATHADAVVGVTLSIAGFGTKAEAIVMSGTAVRTSDLEPVGGTRLERA